MYRIKYPILQQFVDSVIYQWLTQPRFYLMSHFETSKIPEAIQPLTIDGIFSHFIPWPRHNSCRKGVCGNAWFPHNCLAVFYRSGHKIMNPCLCRNRTCPNLVHHQNLESTRPMALCFPGPDDAPHCKMCDFRMGMSSSYIIWISW